MVTVEPQCVERAAGMIRYSTAGVFLRHPSSAPRLMSARSCPPDVLIIPKHASGGASEEVRPGNCNDRDKYKASALTDIAACDVRQRSFESVQWRQVCGNTSYR